VEKSDGLKEGGERKKVFVTSLSTTKKRGGGEGYHLHFLEGGKASKGGGKGRKDPGLYTRAQGGERYSK